MTTLHAPPRLHAPQLVMILIFAFLIISYSITRQVLLPSQGPIWRYWQDWRNNFQPHPPWPKLPSPQSWARMPAPTGSFNSFSTGQGTECLVHKRDHISLLLKTSHWISIPCGISIPCFFPWLLSGLPLASQSLISSCYSQPHWPFIYTLNIQSPTILRTPAHYFPLLETSPPNSYLSPFITDNSYVSLLGYPPRSLGQYRRLDPHVINSQITLYALLRMQHISDPWMSSLFCFKYHLKSDPNCLVLFSKNVAQFLLHCHQQISVGLNLTVKPEATWSKDETGSLVFYVNP